LPERRAERNLQNIKPLFSFDSYLGLCESRVELVAQVLSRLWALDRRRRRRRRPSANSVIEQYRTASTRILK